MHDWMVKPCAAAGVALLELAAVIHRMEGLKAYWANLCLVHFLPPRLLVALPVTFGGMVVF